MEASVSGDSSNSNRPSRRYLWCNFFTNCGICCFC
uniref:Uncharacterized protein MANES_18G072100 n=1 Tax=Rhizophora mucronata TaxID=61149 RepID=A0A2P2PSA1_RHIMU